MHHNVHVCAMLIFVAALVYRSVHHTTNVATPQNICHVHVHMADVLGGVVTWTEQCSNYMYVHVHAHVSGCMHACQVFVGVAC